jgi:hypothetical protein
LRRVGLVALHQDKSGQSENDDCRRDDNHHIYLLIVCQPDSLTAKNLMRLTCLPRRL